MIALTVVGDPEAAARTTAERVAAAIRAALEERGEAHVALSGGRTPERTYRLLPQVVPSWEGVHLWLGDERCVPLDDPESNYGLVARTLLAAPLEPPPHVHPVAGADEDPAGAAAAYERALRAALPGNPPRLDLALLGIGEDGHTASLFPGQPALQVTRRWAIEVTGAKSEPRITLTYPALDSSRDVAFVVTGSGKRDVVARAETGDRTIPAGLVRPVGRLHWFTDRAAAAEGAT